MQTHVDLHKHLQQRQASGFVVVWRSAWVCLRECGVRSTGVLGLYEGGESCFTGGIFVFV